MNKPGVILFATVVILALIAANIWWQVYRFNDCRAVGHSRLYCILTIGK